MPEAAKKLKRKSEARIRLLSQPPLDWPLAIIVLTLVVFGLVMLFSASYATAYYRFKGDSFHFIRQQALFAAVGVVVMFVASHVDYHIFHKFAWPIMAVTVVLLIVVLFMPELNGAKRWIFLPIGGNLQPSEVAKFAVIVLFAHIISINHKRMKTFAYGVLPFVVILGVIAGLMLLEPHLSGTVLILGIGGLMMFVGGTGLVWFGLAIAGVVAGVAGAVVLVPDLVPYAMSRIESWQNPWLDAQGDGHQIILFVALLLRGIYVAWHAKDKFGSMLVVGVIVQVTLQAVLNIAVVTKTIPNTGISLPFFSYGGTSLLMLLGEMGVVLSVSRQGGAEKV